MKILITGGLGHIGSKLIHSLNATDLVVVDNLMTQRYSTLFNLPDSRNVFFFEKNVKDITKDWIQEIGSVDAIIHLAATTDAAGNANNRDALFQNNLDSTKHIADVAYELGIKIIFPSSTSVYGSQSELVDEECKVLLPQSPYAESKIEEEKYLQEMSKHGLQMVILRFGTIHGASRGMRFHTAVNKFIFQVKLGIPITVWRTALDQKRPYLSLDDCVSAIDHVLREDLFDGEIYNIVTKNWTVREIVTNIERVSGFKPAIELVDSQIMNQLSYEVSSRKFENTGFHFKGNLVDDIHDSFKLLSGISNV